MRRVARQTTATPPSPKITADDLIACKTEITKLHQLEIIFLKNETRTECASGKQDNLENCKHATDWLNGSSSKSDIDWFVEGNDSCSGSDYPCYGLGLYNDETPREDLIRDLSLDTYKLPTSFEGRNWGDYSFVVDHCMAKVWVAKMDGQQAPLESDAPTSSLPSPVSDGNPEPASQDTPVKPDPAGPASSTPNVAGLSQQQIAACSEDIKRKQVESQSWGGDVNATANRLGRFQKELFEGRCAGHPEAARYLTGANKMLGYSSEETSSGHLPPLRPDTQSPERTSPQAQGSKSVQVPKSAPVSDCLQLKRDKNNVFVGTNICNFTVQYSYCVESTDRSLFACKNPNGSDEGAGWVRAGGTTTFVGSSKGTGVRWIACKGRIGEVLPFINHKGKQGCY